ncbi:hypothetical protein BGZ76_001736 [Entomortierella beljakovae]|nr:hypothetical protein BGZ76_001736 [Entomortierella beljakovae]
MHPIPPPIQSDVDSKVSQKRLATLPSPNSKQVQELTNHPPTPRTKPKPTPIATRLPSRSSSMISIDDGIGQDSERININTINSLGDHTPIPFQTNECYSPASAESTEFSGRDSGVALESWDNLKQEWDKSPQKEQFPTFDQLLQPQFDLLDPFKSNFGQKFERRQRCQSLVYPKSSHEIEIDFVPSEPEQEQSNVPNLTNTSQPKQRCITRSKRVSSMSIGSNTIDSKNPLLFSHDLPPLPPKASIAPAIPRTSFFAPPSQHESWMDNGQSQPNASKFSNILDLATAKAENITGLYFAKQLNRRSTSLSPLNTPLDLTPGSSSDSPNIPPSTKSCPDKSDVTPVKIEIDAPSPILANIPLQPDTDSTQIPGQPCLKAPNMDIRSNLTKNESPGTTPSAPTRGQHRRSHSASHFFHLSSLKHHSPAQFNLALCYEHGQGGVDRDLKKAVYFYQQAADQGHTKASYNIGCICYNQGEVSKAMAWFESAGKCRIRGLVSDDDSSEGNFSHNSQEKSQQFPLPRQAILPHGLEDILLGDKQSTTGPFAAYLPSILCLALLCRQGVQTRDGKTILKKDPEQSVELLHVLVRKASRSPSYKEKERMESTHPVSQSSYRDRSLVGGNGRSNSSVQCGLNQRDHGKLTSLLSTSCPSLPLGVQSEKSQHDSSYDDSIPGSSSRSLRDKAKRRSTVEDESEIEMPLDKNTFLASTSTHESDDLQSNDPALDQQGSDDHESWSVTLAEQLLKVWKSVMAVNGDDAAEVERRHNRILRHHLLYITNPTLSKNLYNLGVLYDLHLGNPVIAVKCYRSAYQQELPPEAIQQQSKFVTRINSAWNLGVFHVRRKEWKLAREWFMRGQQDIQLPTTIRGPKRSLVNVIPQTRTPLVTDSPGRKHAQQHGLMMRLNSIPIKMNSNANEKHLLNRRSNEAQKINSTEDGIRTDSGKIAWVLRWVESNL